MHLVLCVIEALSVFHGAMEESLDSVSDASIVANPVPVKPLSRASSDDSFDFDNSEHEEVKEP